MFSENPTNNTRLRSAITASVSPGVLLQLAFSDEEKRGTYSVNAAFSLAEFPSVTAVGSKNPLAAQGGFAIGRVLYTA